MKIKENSEIIVGLIFLLILIAFLNPWLMLTMGEMLIIVAAIIVFGLYAVFVWREGSADEREQLHRGLAGRFSFLAGAATLLIAIIIQGLAHDLDKWLVISLGVMVISKVAALVYLKNKQ